MLVEPETLCWLTGRMVPARDGATWAEEFARLPALKSVVRDDGTGLGKGLRMDCARGRAARLGDLDDSLDVFHTLHEEAFRLSCDCFSEARKLSLFDSKLLQRPEVVRQDR